MLDCRDAFARFSDAAEHFSYAAERRNFTFSNGLSRRESRSVKQKSLQTRALQALPVYLR
jgi:hypothetical protein